MGPRMSVCWSISWLVVRSVIIYGRKLNFHGSYRRTCLTTNLLLWKVEVFIINHLFIIYYWKSVSYIAMLLSQSICCIDNSNFYWLPRE